MIELFNRLAGALKRWLRPDPDAATDRAGVGRRGEREAARYLKRRRWKILERNFSTRRGEIDLIATRGGVVAFVEVRSQTKPIRIQPEATVTRGKQRRIIRAAQAYCARKKLGQEGMALRFDVLTVRFAEGARPDVRHIEDAFQLTRSGF
ncbi:MAG: YraN family protein [Planctomycetota bacterium]